MGRKSRARRLRRGTIEAPRIASGVPPPPTLTAAAHRRVLFILLGAGLLLRILYLLEYRSESMFYGHLMLDAQVYDDWARRIATGAWLGGPVFYHAPLYPYLLALFFRFLGHHYLPVYAFQLLLGVAVLLLVDRIGRRCASPAAGLAAAALLLFYPALPFFETKLMSTAVGLALATGALALLVEAWEVGRAARWLAAGAGIGVAALAHPASLLLAPVFAGALLLRTRTLRDAICLAAGVILGVAPATIHNLAAGGGFVLISSQGGITFLQGNAPSSRGLYRPVDGFTGSPLTQEQEERRLAERAMGRPLRASEISSYWFKKGLEGIRDQPGRYLDLLQLKLIRWFSSHEYSTEYSLSLERRQLVSLWIPFLPFGFLVAAAAAGAILARGTYPRLAPVYLFFLATAAPPLVFYVSSRYRINVVPALALLGGVAVERLCARWRAAGWVEILPAAAAILLLGSMSLIPYGRDHLFQEANVHYNVGNLYFDTGDYERAIQEYQQALEVSDFEYYRINLGNAFARTGRHEEAIAQYRHVAARKPRFAKAYIQWAKVLLDQGRGGEARELYEKARALGARNADLEGKLGDAVPESASAAELEAARRAVVTDPGNASLHNSLGLALQKAGRADEAEQEYRRASALDPHHENSRYHLGLLLEGRGRLEEAVAEFEASTRINPDHVRAHLKAASLLLRRGERARARGHFLAVLRIEPDNAEAREGLRHTREGP